MAYVIGALLDYRTIPCIFVFVPIVFAICFTFLPNTPQFHLQKGNLKKAESALKFYKGCDGKDAAEANALNAEFDRLKSIANERKIDEKTHLSDFRE